MSDLEQEQAEEAARNQYVLAERNAFAEAIFAFALKRLNEQLHGAPLNPSLNGVFMHVSGGPGALTIDVLLPDYTYVEIVVRARDEMRRPVTDHP